MAIQKSEISVAVWPVRFWKRLNFYFKNYYSSVLWCVQFSGLQGEWIKVLDQTDPQSAPHFRRRPPDVDSTFYNNFARGVGIRPQGIAWAESCPEG